MTIFFTADFHFGHKNIIRYCNRPFKDVKHMNNIIIKNFNKRVKNEDIVYFLGDFCFDDFLKFKNRLNGKIIFIKGNHDKIRAQKSIVLQIDNTKLFLVHNPVDSNKNYKINLCAHIHANWKFARQNGVDIINVGVDVWDYKPVTFEEIMKEYNEWVKNGRLT